MNTKIKICGITNLKDALLCCELGADYLGFIFYKNSPRYIPVEMAKNIAARLPETILKVGVFVNEVRGTITDIIDSVGLNLVQLSGNERPEDCLGYNVPIIKSITLNSEHTIAQAKLFSVEAILIDSKTENEFGGTGKLSNWELAAATAKTSKIFLAGGLNSENIKEAIERVHPFAVDVNSGVEHAPGKKDIYKLHRLFETIHSLN